MRKGKVLTNHKGVVQIFDIEAKKFVKLSMPNLLQAVENEPWGHRDSLENRGRKEIILNYRIISERKENE